MKTGICPKCQSNSVYVKDGKGLRMQGEAYGVQVHIDSLFKLKTYLCENCGYIELYSDNLSDERKPVTRAVDLNKSEEWKKVESK